MTKRFGLLFFYEALECPCITPVDEVSQLFDQLFVSSNPADEFGKLGDLFNADLLPGWTAQLNTLQHTVFAAEPAADFFANGADLKSVQYFCKALAVFGAKSVKGSAKGVVIGGETPHSASHSGQSCGNIWVLNAIAHRSLLRFVWVSS